MFLYPLERKTFCVAISMLLMDTGNGLAITETEVGNTCFGNFLSAQETKGYVAESEHRCDGTKSDTDR